MGISCASAGSTASTAEAAAAELIGGLRAGVLDPDLVVIAASASYDVGVLRSHVRAAFPKARLHGATSCLGSMTDRGIHIGEGRGAAAFAISDPTGGFGTGSAPLDDGEGALVALQRALADARRPGEAPAVVWISAAPGFEERVIACIERELGPEVPVIGGSAADDRVEGVWRVFDGDEVHQGVVVTVMFPSGPIAYAFHSGYEPTARVGTVTRASGRTILEIDGQPAAAVYNDWIGGTLDLSTLPAPVLMATTLHPLGREVGRIGGVPYYQLSHPEAVTADLGLRLFTSIEPGDRIHVMTGSVDLLTERAGRVVRAALAAHETRPEDVSGALVVYCAGCMLTVRPELDRVVRSIDQVLGGVPFLGTFTFGEQGCLLGGENRHGNLMISALLFGTDRG